MVAGPPKQGHLRHIDRGGVAILWKTSANWESKTRNSIRPRFAPIGTLTSAPRGQSSPNASYTQYTLPEYIPALTGQAPKISTTPSSNRTSSPHPPHMFTLAILMPTSRKNLKKHPWRCQSEQYPHEKETWPGMTHPASATPRPPPTWALSRITQPRRNEGDCY